MINGTLQPFGTRPEEIACRNSKVYVHQQEEVATVSLGKRTICDLSDLRLLREVSGRLVHVRRCRVITVDLRSAQSLASGFFGFLYDLCKQGVNVRLLAPHRRVREMLWFRAFCKHLVDDCYELLVESRSQVLHDARNQWRRKTGPAREADRTASTDGGTAESPVDTSVTAATGGETCGESSGIGSVPSDASCAVAPLTVLGTCLES